MKLAEQIKSGKLPIVIVLTILIWVWADLAQDQSIEVSTLVVRVARSDPALWVRLSTDSASLKQAVPLTGVTLVGPQSRIPDADRRLKEGAFDTQIYLTPESEAFTESGTYTLDVLNFLRRAKQLRELGLSVESCTPKTIAVDVVKLVERPIEVECLNENDNPIRVQSIDPPRVTALVPPDTPIKARVRLTRTEIEQARLAPVTKTPSVELAGVEPQQLATTVKITMPSEGVLRDYTIQPAILGYVLSSNLQGKVRVELLNDPGSINIVRIKATPLAKQAFDQQPFQLMLYILDDEINNPEEQEKALVFNFPQEYVQRGEIMYDQPAPVARFKLVRLTPAAPEGGM